MSARTAVGLAVVGGCLLLGTARSSRAQPGQPPPVAAVDSTEVVEAYQNGFTALIEGDLPTAERWLELAASRSVETDRRAAAAELLRLVRALRARGLRIAPGEVSGPGTPAKQVAATADEDPDAGPTRPSWAPTCVSYPTCSWMSCAGTLTEADICS